MNEKRYNEIMNMGDVGLNESVSDNELDAVNIRYDQEYKASTKYYLNSKRELRQLLKNGIISRKIADTGRKILQEIYCSNI